MPDTKKCQHLVTVEGPRLPLRWGSAGTALCRCGKWTDVRSKPDWRPLRELVDAIVEEREEARRG